MKGSCLYAPGLFCSHHLPSRHQQLHCCSSPVGQTSVPLSTQRLWLTHTQITISRETVNINGLNHGLRLERITSERASCPPRSRPSVRRTAVRYPSPTVPSVGGQPAVSLTAITKTRPIIASPLRLPVYWPDSAVHSRLPPRSTERVTGRDSGILSTTTVLLVSCCLCAWAACCLSAPALALSRRYNTASQPVDHLITTITSVLPSIAMQSTASSQKLLRAWHDAMKKGLTCTVYTTCWGDWKCGSSLAVDGQLNLECKERQH